jgi:hypothetical protein
MKKIVVLFYFLICTVGISHVSAQINLVPNPSFEDTITCINGYSDRPIFWYTPTNGTPDYFRQPLVLGPCYDSATNQWGGSYSNGKIANTGVAFVGMIVMNLPGNNFREFLQVELNETLITGNKYCVSFYTTIRGDSKYAIDALGGALTEDSIVNYSSSGLLMLQADIDNYGKGIITDTLNWILISDTIVANGGEKYLTIGHIRSDDSTNYIQFQSTGPNQSYYFIDDVSVILLDETPPPTPIYPEIIMYPTPSVNGIFTIEYELAAGAVLEVYDMLGQLVANIFLEAGAHQQTIALNSLAAAVYHYRVVQDGNQLKYGKLLIAK